MCCAGSKRRKPAWRSDARRSSIVAAERKRGVRGEAESCFGNDCTFFMLIDLRLKNGNGGGDDHRFDQRHVPAVRDRETRWFLPLPLEVGVHLVAGAGGRKRHSGCLCTGSSEIEERKHYHRYISHVRHGVGTLIMEMYLRTVIAVKMSSGKSRIAAPQSRSPNTAPLTFAGQIID